MKKSRCPPESKGCEHPNVHMDIAVPGFDFLQESTANVCAERKKTLFTAKKDSEILGLWWKQRKFGPDGQCSEGCSLDLPQYRDRCEYLPPEFIRSCQLFADWGWNHGVSKNVQFKPVECPERFTEWVGSVFDETGVTNTRAWPTTTTTTTAPTTTTTTQTRTSTTTTTNNRTTSRFVALRPQLSARAPEELQNDPDSNVGTIVAISSVGSICLLASCGMIFCMNAMHWKLCCGGGGGNKEDFIPNNRRKGGATPKSRGGVTPKNGFDSIRGSRDTRHQTPHTAPTPLNPDFEFEL